MTPVVTVFWQPDEGAVWVEQHTLLPDLKVAASTGTSRRLSEAEFRETGSQVVRECLECFASQENLGPSSIDRLPEDERRRFYEASRLFVVRPVNVHRLRISFMKNARPDGSNSGHNTEDVDVVDFSRDPLDALAVLSEPVPGRTDI